MWQRCHNYDIVEKFEINSDDIFDQSVIDETSLFPVLEATDWTFYRRMYKNIYNITKTKSVCFWSFANCKLQF